MKGLELAKYLSIVTAVLLVLAGVTSSLAITIPSLVFGFALVPVFISWMVCIHYFSTDNKLFGLMGISFSIVYGVLISFNYFFQLGFMGRSLPIPDLFEMSNPDSMFMIVEILGYFFMGLATLVIIPLFSKDGLGRSIKVLCFVNFLLGIGGVVGYALNWNFHLMLGGLIIWNVIMPFLAILIFYHFKNLKSVD